MVLGRSKMPVPVLFVMYSQWIYSLGVAFSWCHVSGELISRVSEFRFFFCGTQKPVLFPCRFVLIIFERTYGGKQTS